MPVHDLAEPPELLNEECFAVIPVSEKGAALLLGVRYAGHALVGS